MAIQWSTIVQKAIDAKGDKIEALKASKKSHSAYAKKLGLFAERVPQGNDVYALMVWIDPENPPTVPGKVGRPASDGKGSPAFQARMYWLNNASPEELRKGTPEWLAALEKAELIHNTSPEVQAKVDWLLSAPDEELRLATESVASKIRSGDL